MASSCAARGQAPRSQQLKWRRSGDEVSSSSASVPRTPSGAASAGRAHACPEDVDAREQAGRRRVADADHLVRLALAAVRRAEQLRTCRASPTPARLRQKLDRDAAVVRVAAPRSASLPSSMSWPHSQPNWNLLRESSIDHERLVLHQHAALDRRRSARRSVASPGSTLRLAMRSIGGAVPAASARVGDARRCPRAPARSAPPSGALEHAVAIR